MTQVFVQSASDYLAYQFLVASQCLRIPNTRSIAVSRCPAIGAVQLCELSQLSIHGIVYRGLMIAILPIRRVARRGRKCTTQESN